MATVLSILDTDLYKFSTSYAYMRLYPEAEGTFVFTDREHNKFDSDFIRELKMEFAQLGALKMSKEEFDWLKDGAIPYIPLHYWEWLSGHFRFDPDKIKVWLDDENELHIEVTDKLYKVTLYEVPILAIVGEMRNKYFGITLKHDKMMRILDDKIRYANQHGLNFSEFGTRRRFSANTQEDIIEMLKEKCPVCSGTSNVYFAFKFNMRPQGTFPHEWVMFHGAIGGYKKANQRSLEDWQAVYRGDLGTALIDTYTTDVFLKEFTKELAKLFDSCRQDSGDEFIIGNKIIERYKALGIDPTTKTIIFSNALTLPKYHEIKKYFQGRIGTAAGIGGDIANDPGIEGYKRPNMVMKLLQCRMSPREEWQKCIKISDDLGKHMGDEKEYEIACYQLGIKG